MKKEKKYNFGLAAYEELDLCNKCGNQGFTEIAENEFECNNCGDIIKHDSETKSDLENEKRKK